MARTLVLVAVVLIGVMAAHEKKGSIDKGQLCPYCTQLIANGEAQGDKYSLEWLNQEIKTLCNAAWIVAHDCLIEFDTFESEFDLYIKQKWNAALACQMMPFC